VVFVDLLDEREQALAGLARGDRHAEGISCSSTR
jgi:hypothetical protein